MTKILMTSVRPDEQAAIDAYAAAHQIEIITSPHVIQASLDLVPGVDGVVIQQRGAVPAEVYPFLKQHGLRQITTRTAGVDTIDLPLARANGLVVTNVPAYSPRSVAEFALMQIFRLLRHTPTLDHRVAAGDFRWAGLQAKEIHTATIGIIGVGRIGGTLAQLLHALGAKVLGFDLKPRPELAEIVEYTTKRELLARADVVSLHVDLNPTSVGLIGAPELALMQPSASLVNASRGPVVDTAALIAALKEHTIAAAALDTVEGEAPVFNQDHHADLATLPTPIQTLLALPNVIMTPHIAFFTNQAVQNMVEIALDDVLAILAGKPSAHEITALP